MEAGGTDERNERENTERDRRGEGGGSDRDRKKREARRGTATGRKKGGGGERRREPDEDRDDGCRGRPARPTKGRRRTTLERPNPQTSEDRRVERTTGYRGVDFAFKSPYAFKICY